MGLRRPGVTKDYEEMPGANVPMPSKHIHHSHLHSQIHGNSPHSHRSTQVDDLNVCQNLEMSSVSVVPDGVYPFVWRLFVIFVLILIRFNRNCRLFISLQPF